MVNLDITPCFNDVYDSTKNIILSFITAKCSDINDVQDIFQETYAEVYSVMVKKGSSYIKEPVTFVRKIAKCKIARFYSYRNKHKTVALYTQNDTDGTETENIESEELSPEEIVADSETVKQINSYLSGKSTEIQKIFYMRFGLDMTLSEIARLLDMGESNVKHKLYRTVKELRKIYCEEGNKDERR